MNDLPTFIISSFFENAYLIVFKPGDLKNDYYCGVTDDLERRAAEHKIEVKDYVYTYKCDTSERALSVEKALCESGFDTGKETGHGQKNSIYIYMYRKIKEKTNP